MAASQTPIKEIVKRTDIRTMKKDLKRAREADTVKERNKIVSFNPKESGGEMEKQKLFILESQKTELKKQLAAKTQKITPVTQEKNRLVQAQQQWQQKVDKLAAKEASEKNRWPIERKLSQATEQLKKVSAEHETFTKEEQEIQEQIAKTDSDVNVLNTTIKQQEEKAKQIQATPIQPEPTPVTPSIPEKPYLKNASAATKETIAKITPKENVQRKKFMEEVEAWAAAMK